MEFTLPPPDKHYTTDGKLIPVTERGCKCSQCVRELVKLGGHAALAYSTPAEQRKADRAEHTSRNRR